jgi:hypothetical protein
MDIASAVAVESLLEKLRAIPQDSSSFELLLPATLTFESKPILRAAGVEIIQEALEAKGFVPAGTTYAHEGTLCSYRRA